MFDLLKNKGTFVASVLTLIAFILWLFSLLPARNAIVTADMSELGLFSILPVSFFVAFGLLVLAFFITLITGSQNRSYLFFCQTVLLILFLTLTPSIIEGIPRFTSSYVNYNAVDYIIQTGQVSSQVLWVHNWPLFSILISIFEQVTAVSGQSILLFYSTFFNILFIIPLYVFFRLILPDSRFVWLALWFVFLANWIGQDYFSMQSLAFLVSVLLLFMLFKNMNQKMHTRPWFVVFSLLFFFIASSHFLTSILILCAVFVLYITKHMPRPAFVASLFVIISSWTIFNASSYIASNFGSLIRQSLNLTLLLQKNLTNRLSGGAGHVLVADVRIIYSAVIIAFAIGSVILAWRTKKLGITEKRLLLIVLSFALLLFGSSYGGELFMRLYMFSLVIFAYFVSKALLKYKRFFYAGLLFFVIFAPSFIMISHYGNESIDYVPYGESAGVAFLYGASNGGLVVGGTLHPGDFRDLTYRQNYTISSLRDMYLRNSTALPEANVNRYVCISYGSLAFLSTYVGDPSFIENIEGNLSQSMRSNLIYSNPRFSIFYSPTLTNP